MINSGEEPVYYTPAKKARCSFKVKGSRFIATLAPVTAVAAVNYVLEQVRLEFPAATHHAFAYRIGAPNSLERAFDDGEPVGTAGYPMLQVLQGEAVSGTLIIGTRFFGGTKLGIGGLTRAYRQCASKALAAVDLVRKEEKTTYTFILDYPAFGVLEGLLDSLDGEILATDYGSRVRLRAAVPTRSSGAVLEGFENLTRGRGFWKKHET